MKIALIAALDRNRVIGKNNDLPWRLPDDMKFFMETTMGHPVIMGRRNFDSIPPKYRPLPGRTNIVLTRKDDFQAPGVVVAHDPEEALSKAREKESEEIFIIGGAEVYALFINEANRLYLTEIDATVSGDTFFPNFDLKEWKEISRKPHPADERHAYSFDFVVYERLTK